MFFSNVMNWFVRPSNVKPAGKARLARIGIEHLETREVPAAIAASLTNNVLTITGTPQADTIRVHQINNSISVGGVTISQLGKSVWSVPKGAVSKIVVNSGDGNDLIDLHSNSYSNSQLIRIPAVVGTGADNDTVYGTEANDKLDGGTGYDKIWGYGGNDTIFAQVGRDRVAGGTGDDTINAELGFANLVSAKSGRLFWDDSFAAGNGTDTVNVSLSRETFGSKLLTPAVEKLKAATHTFDPVLKLLDRRVPVLSQFDSGLTYRSLLSSFSPEAGQFLNAISTIRNLDSSANLSGWVDIGSFKVASGSSPAIRTVWADPLGQVNSSLVNAARKAGIRFGLLEDSQSAIRMMMGKNVDLVSLRLELPKIKAEINKTYPVMFFGPFTIEADFGGKVWASAGATFGVDMSGVWNGNLLKGFFIKQATASVGTHAWVKGGAALGVSDVLSIGSVKGYGEVGGTINFGLTGGKSKLYLADMPKSFSQAFNPLGRVNYDVGIEIKYSKLKWHRTWWGARYPEWVGAKHRESFGKGSFRM